MSDLTPTEPVKEDTIRGERGLPTQNQTDFASSDRGIDTLAMIEGDSPARSSIDWDLIDRAIQERLSQLTGRLLRGIPNLVSKSGSHRARHILLSSYKIYKRLDGDDHDSVYAGLTIVKEAGAVRISGDISGEESGHIYFDQGCELMATLELESVLATAIEVSSRISAQDKIVVQAIRATRAT